MANPTPNRVDARNADARIAKTIEQVLLEPRPAFASPAEFSLYLASRLENAIRAREEIAYRMGEASEAGHKVQLH